MIGAHSLVSVTIIFVLLNVLAFDLLRGTDKE